MKKITFSLVCALIGFVIVLSGCSSSVAQFSTATPEPNENTQIISVSGLAFDFDGLIRANLIIEGTIGGIQSTGREFLGPGDSTGSIYTYYKVDIAKVLKSPLGFADRSVIVRHWGGTYQGKTQKVKGDEPYQVGQKVLLFLRDPSLFAGQPIPGEKKDYYVVLMAGGRFHIKPDGSLDSPSEGLAVTNQYRGKNVSVLEKDILAKIPNLPTPWDYMQQAGVGAFLIVEGKVGPVQRTWMEWDETPTPEQWARIKTQGELPHQVHTFYSFTVDQIIKDKLAEFQSKDARYVPVDYQGIPPVKPGDVITVVEKDGTYEGITQKRWGPVPLLKPGDRMFLFLSALVCRESFSGFCTKAEQASKKILYSDYGTINRFFIEPDNRLMALFPSEIGRMYDKQPKSKLEKDLVDAIAKYEKDMEEWMRKQPTPAPVLSPPPTRRPYP